MFPASVWEKVRALGAGDLVVELRGWRWGVVGPRRSFMPCVYEVCSPCPTRRDVYLRRVMGVRAGGGVLRAGRAVHEAFLTPFRVAVSRELSSELLSSLKGRVLRGVDGWIRKAVSRVFDYAASLASRWVIDGRSPPVSVEPCFPGSPIGLSDVVRPDLVVGVVPVEVVLGNGFGRKRLALAAYAMSIEACTSTPVNYGVVLAVSREGSARWRVVLVDDALRREFLDVRDSVARLVEEGDDPGVADSCPDTCPWGWACRGGTLRM